MADQDTSSPVTLPTPPTVTPVPQEPVVAPLVQVPAITVTADPTPDSVIPPNPIAAPAPLSEPSSDSVLTQQAPLPEPVQSLEPVQPQEPVQLPVLSPVQAAGDDDASLAEVVDPLMDSAGVPEPTTDAATPSDAAAGDGEKSPLDILEEILANAESEKSQADQEKLAKDQEEQQFQAQLAAKQEAFKQEADTRIQTAVAALGDAKTQREEVDQTLRDVGKLKDTVGPLDDQYTIRQLQHKQSE